MSWHVCDLKATSPPMWKGRQDLGRVTSWVREQVGYQCEAKWNHLIPGRKRVPALFSFHVNSVLT